MITARRRALVSLLKTAEASIYALDRAVRFEEDETKCAELLSNRDALQADVDQLVEALGA